MTGEPAAARVTVTMNGEPVEVPGDGTLADLIDVRIAASRGSTRGIAAAVDGTVVPRAAWPVTILRDRQSVEVLTAVQGG